MELTKEEVSALKVEYAKALAKLSANEKLLALREEQGVSEDVTELEKIIDFQERYCANLKDIIVNGQNTDVLN